MILREFLYVDTDKVRALLAQLDDGIAEESLETERKEKRTTIGPRSAAQHLQGTGSESYTNKSLGDALFPTLEESLESELLPQCWPTGRRCRLTCAVCATPAPTSPRPLASGYGEQSFHAPDQQ